MKFMRKKLQHSILIITLISLLGNSQFVHAAEIDTAPSVEIPLITSFDELSSEHSAHSFDNRPDLSELLAVFPQNLTAYLDSSEEHTEIPVTWKCDQDYNSTDSESYDFVPVWDETLYTLSPSLDPAKDIPHITVNVNTEKSSTYLSDLTSAQSDLDTIVKDKDILALVYLVDSYEIKKEAFGHSATVISVNSGQSVQIIGIGEDSRKNIWYRVSFNIQGTTYNGYVERSYLAYSDEGLLSFESEHITTAPVTARAFGIQSFSAVSSVPADIAQFPESYQSALIALKDTYPQWTFVMMDTKLNWSSAIAKQNQNTRSLIHASVNSAWKNGSYNSSWAYPTDGILAYYMDPRNFLTDSYIFQFEQLTYNPTYHTEVAVQGLLDGSFMSGAIPEGNHQPYSKAFMSIAGEYRVSPFHLSSRVLQEQGKDGTSPLISGTYSGYTGLYNYFNIGAFGKENTEVIVSGLKKAQEYGWTSRYLSLRGGSNIISKNYIQIGQDTLYLQKFNVTETDTHNHQYMQNIAAPSSEAQSVRKAYANAGSLNRPFVFRIPVYQGMPSNACIKPTTVKEVTLSESSITLATDKTHNLTAFIDNTQVAASSITFKSENTSIAKVDTNGVVTAIYPGTTTITATVSGGSIASCKVTVQKIDPVYTVPTLKGITYDPNQKLSSISLSTGWSFDAPDTVPTVKNSGYAATFTPTDTGKYNTIKKTLPLTVTKGTPSYTVPTGLQTVSGNTLASIKLPAGFAWESPTTVLSKEGSVSHKASYNPDPANYNTVTGIAIAITVNAVPTTECTNHDFGEWEHTKEATCTEAGIDTRSCHICGFKETRTVPALGHSYTSKITKEATCTEKGIRTYTCSRCGDTYTEEIPALGHNYTAKVTKEATTTEEGIRTYTCSRSGDTYTEVIPKLPSDQPSPPKPSVPDGNNSSGGGSDTPNNNTGSGTNNNSGTNTDSNTDTSSNTNTGPNTDTTPNTSTNSNTNTNTGANSNTNTTPNTNTNTNTDTSPDSDTNENANSGSNANNSGNTSPESSNADTGSKSNTSGSSSPSSSEDKKTAEGRATIDMKKNTVLYEESLSSIRGKDVDVVLSMGNSISWVINGRNIVADEANGIDMGVAMNTGNIPSAILTAAKGGNENVTVIELTLAHNGSFDFSPILTINTAKDSAGRIANLFYYNPESEQLEFVDEAEVTEAGDIIFTFAHASDYAVIISDSSMAELAVISEASTTDENIDEEAADIEVLSSAVKTGNNGLNPRIIVIVIVILLICAAVGAAVFFLLTKKEVDDAEEDEASDEDYSADTVPERSKDKQVPLSTTSSRKKSSHEESSYEDNEYGDLDDDFVDDYREPEINTKKTGKVISITKLKNQEKKESSNRDNFDNDEFDGFE